MARVRGDLRAAIVSAVTNKVCSSTSAKTGFAPTIATQLAVAPNEMAGTMTSSPGPIPSTCMMPWSAAVPLLTATASRVPVRAATAASSSATFSCLSFN